MARHIEARVDYVHDEPAVRALCRQGGVAFLMPPFEKSDLFKGIVMGGVLPRKTFSMGHAEEKRYYMECPYCGNAHAISKETYLQIKEGVPSQPAAQQTPATQAAAAQDPFNGQFDAPAAQEQAPAAAQSTDEQPAK